MTSRFQRISISVLGVFLGCTAAATWGAPTMGGTLASQRALESQQTALAQSSCAALITAATAKPGQGPMLLPSYPTMHLDSSSIPALDNVAFVYDNALAGIALVACGQSQAARRIADALLLAPASDPDFTDGRLRNAYRAGPITDGKVALPGYWNRAGNFWSQDAYQMGTATGNAAWAALLLLTVYGASNEPRYLDAACAQLAWIDQHAANATAAAGYQGGWFGYARAQHEQTWKSTEQNIDVYAAARWASSLRPTPSVARERDVAAGFVKAMWDRNGKRFYIGTEADGHTPSTELSGLDAQIWPLLAFQPPPSAWHDVWLWVEAEHRSGAGYGFKRHPDGIWTEGTAQVAAALQASGKPVPDALWQLLAAQRSANGMLQATPQASIATGLAIGPTSTRADFYYYHLPHLGATAWAAIAALGWNPFVGSSIAPSRAPS